MKEFDPDAHTAEARVTWSEAAPRYEKLSSALFTGIAQEFVAFAELRRGWRVLDVACGPGVASRAAAKRIGETGRVHAVDLAPGMIEMAAGRTPEKRAAPIEWGVMNAEALEVPSAAFDAVVCQLGLMLFARPERALAEMRRAVVAGGTVACLVQGRRSAMKFTSLVFDAMLERARDLKAPPGAPTLYSFGSDGVLEEAFMGAGLTEISTKRLTGVFRFESAREYWSVMTEGAGKTGAMLRSLPEPIQEKIKGDVLRRAGKLRSGKGVAIPYEFAMARGFAPSLR